MKKVIAILFLAVLAAGAFIGWGWYQDNRMPNFKGSADIYVRPGDTVEDVISQIKEQTTIINESRLRAVFEEKQVKDYLKPGYFRLGKSNSSVYAARMLNNGWQSPVRLTLSGNLRIKSNIAAKIASQLLIDSLTVQRPQRHRTSRKIRLHPADSLLNARARHLRALLDRRHRGHLR